MGMTQNRRPKGPRLLTGHGLMAPREGPRRRSHPITPLPTTFSSTLQPVPVES